MCDNQPSFRQNIKRIVASLCTKCTAAKNTGSVIVNNRILYYTWHMVRSCNGMGTGLAIERSWVQLLTMLLPCNDWASYSLTCPYVTKQHNSAQRKDDDVQWLGKQPRTWQKVMSPNCKIPAYHTWAPQRCVHDEALYKSTFTLP